MDSILLNYGVLGVVAIALSSFILTMYKDLKSLTKEGHDAVNRNTDIVAQLKTLLETTRERI